MYILKLYLILYLIDLFTPNFHCFPVQKVDLCQS